MTTPAEDARREADLRALTENMRGSNNTFLFRLLDQERAKSEGLRQRHPRYDGERRDTVSEDHMWNIARIAARNALAEIGGNQMHTWAKFPSTESPFDIIARHVVEALQSASDGGER